MISLETSVSSTEEVEFLDGQQIIIHTGDSFRNTIMDRYLQFSFKEELNRIVSQQARIRGISTSTVEFAQLVSMMTPELNSILGHVHITPGITQKIDKFLGIYICKRCHHSIVRPSHTWQECDEWLSGHVLGL